MRVGEIVVIDIDNNGYDAEDDDDGNCKEHTSYS